MQLFKKLVFEHPKGLHARVAATIVKKANDLQNMYNTKLFIGVSKKHIFPANNLISVSSLNIRKGDKYYIAVEGTNARPSLAEFADFLKKGFNLEDRKTMNQIDSILQETTITVDKVFENMANGLIIVNKNGIIIDFNPAAEKIIGVQAQDVIGENVKEVIPNTRLDIVLKEGKKELGQMQKINDETYIATNRAPIVHQGEIIGAVAIFQDVSTIRKLSNELREIKALKKRLELILESVQEGICVIDREGNINYINSAYEDLLSIRRESFINRNIGELLTDMDFKDVFESGMVISGKVDIKEKNTIVSNIYPIIIDKKNEGAVLLTRKKDEIERLAEKLSRLTAKAEYLENELERKKKLNDSFNRIIGVSGKLREALTIANKAAKSKSTVLIRGESGTGKELVAEAIHYASKRNSEAFIRVNCAAIPVNLLESELFGHEKGAFTGAIAKKMGKFELADKGTVFLDEIGELPLLMQAKLLRFLQDQTFERIGGTDVIKVDVRIIAATNRNLEELMKKGEFREDLYYRLNVLPVFLPPLRERKEDIPLLVDHFIKVISHKLNRKKLDITETALETLIEYNWPGNIRELQNVIERAINISESNLISYADLPGYIKKERPEPLSLINLSNNGELFPLERYEKEIIKKALKKYGSFNAAGKALGITHKTVAAKARKYHIVE